MARFDDDVVAIRARREKNPGLIGIRPCRHTGLALPVDPKRKCRSRSRAARSAQTNDWIEGRWMRETVLVLS